MKATGIVRRIDELGRIVIPKEIRRNYRIKEGTPLEIYSGEEGSLILKKYSPMIGIDDFVKECVEAINEVLDCLVLCTDSEKVIGGSGERKKDYLDKELSLDFEKVMEDRKAVLRPSTLSEKIVDVVRDLPNTYSSQIIVPIISDGFAFGSIVLLSNSKMGDAELNLVKSMSIFLSKQII